MDFYRKAGSSTSVWNVRPQPFTYVVHFLGIIAVAFVFVWTVHFRGGLAFSASDKNLIFNVHPVMMLLSFVFLSSQAILVYKTINGSKLFRKVVHLSLQFVALVLACVGISAVFKYHNESNISNLYSLHSWFGLVTVCLFGIQWLAGFISFFYPGLPTPLRAAALPWHVFAGLFIYGLALTTSELGILEKLTFLQTASIIGRYSSEAIFMNCLGIIIGLLGWFVFLSTVIPDAPNRDQSASD